MIQKQYQSNRLILIQSTPDLAPEVCEYYIRNKNFFKQYDRVKDPEFFSIEFQEKQLANDRKKCEKTEISGLRFWIIPKGEKRIIGMAALNGIVYEVFYSSFLSYKLDQDEVNRGYMTEALEVVIQIAFNELRLHRLEANMMPWNLPSARVAEKLGFCREGYSKEYLYINGRWEDHVRMVLLNHNWTGGLS